MEALFSSYHLVYLEGEECVDGMSINESMLVEKVKGLVASWATALPLLQDIPITTMLSNWIDVAFSQLSFPF